LAEGKLKKFEQSGGKNTERGKTSNGQNGAWPGVKDRHSPLRKQRLSGWGRKQERRKKML